MDKDEIITDNINNKFSHLTMRMICTFHALQAGSGMFIFLKLFFLHIQFGTRFFKFFTFYKNFVLN